MFAFMPFTVPPFLQNSIKSCGDKRVAKGEDPDFFLTVFRGVEQVGVKDTRGHLTLE